MQDEKTNKAMQWAMCRPQNLRSATTALALGILSGPTKSVWPDATMWSVGDGDGNGQDPVDVGNQG
jgi:hypothetical protein